MKQSKAIGRLTDLQCDRLDAYAVTYLNKMFDSHQISATADLALLEDLYAPLRIWIKAIILLIYLYIYIYICVCVCVCVYKLYITRMYQLNIQNLAGVWLTTAMLLTAAVISLHTVFFWLPLMLLFKLSDKTSWFNWTCDVSISISRSEKFLFLAGLHFSML